MKLTNPAHRTEESLVDVLTPISRLLVLGAVGVDELIRAAKRSYLRAATDVIVPPGRRLSASRLSVVTGMTRKEVSALLKRSKAEESLAIRRRGQQRAHRVLRGWLTDPRFQVRGARPAELRLSGQNGTFRQLVKLYGGDVTPNAVLRELERMGMVELTTSGVLRIRRRRGDNSPRPDFQLSELAKLFEDFASAVAPRTATAPTPCYFGYKDAVVGSAGEAAAFLETFSRRATALLDGFQQWSAGHGSPKSGDRQSTDPKRVGLGVYLVQAETRSTGKPDEIGQRRNLRPIERRRK